MQMGEAFLTLTPELNKSATSAISAEAGRAGEAAGKTMADKLTSAMESGMKSGTSGLAKGLTTVGEAAGKEAGTKAGKSFSDSLADSVKANESQVEASIGGVWDSAKVGAVAAGGAIGLGLGSALLGALDLGASQEKIRAQLNLTSAESEKIGKTAGDLFSNAYGASLGEVNDAIATVVQNIPNMRDASTPVLKDITAGAMDLSRVFGQDLTQVTRAVGTMMKTGLAPDAQTALDTLTKGFQGGADVAGDLLDTFSEYSTQFRKLGIDGQTAMGLIQQGLKGGARDADVVADAFKEFSIRAIDGSKLTAEGFKAIGVNAGDMAARIGAGGETSKQALDEVIDKLNAMEDPIARDAAGVALFGTQWEDLGDAFKNIDVSDATKALGDVSGATKTLVDQSAQSKLDSFINSIKTGFVTLIGNEVIPRIAAFGDHIKKHSTLYKTLAVVLGVLTAAYIATTAAMAVQAAGGIVAFITTVVTSTKLWTAGQWLLNAALTANPIGIVVVAIAALVAAIVLAYKNSETFRKIVDATWKAIKTAIMAVTDWFIKNVWPGMKKIIDAIGEGFKWLYEKAIKPAWDGIKTAVETSWKGVKIILDGIEAYLKVVGAVWTWLYENAVKPTWKGIEVIVKAAWAILEPVFQRMGEALKLLGAVFTWLYDNAIKPSWDRAVEVVKTAWKGIEIIFKAIDTYIKGPLASAWNWIHDTLIKPLWDKIKAATDVWWNAIKAIFEAINIYIKGPVADAWNWIHDTLIKPLWDKIKLATETWWNAVKAIWETIFEFIKTPFAEAWNWIHDTLIKPLWDKIKAATDVWWAAIKLIWDTIIEFIKGPLADGWNWIHDTLIKPLWDKIKLATDVWWAAIKLIWETIITFIQTTFAAAWNWIHDTLIKPLWDKITLATQTWWAAIQAIWNAIITFIQTTFKAGWDFLSKTVSDTWTAMQTKISTVWNFVRDNIFNPMINFVKTTIPNAFSTGVEAVGKAWDKVKEAAKTPVKFVIDKVINGGIIKGVNWIASKVGASTISPVSVDFASGGVLPGFTPGRDVHRFVNKAGMRLNLSGGEAIMRPEWTRAMGPSFVKRANEVSRRGIGAVRRWMSGVFTPHGWGRRHHERRNRPPRPVVSRKLLSGAFKDGGILEIGDGIGSIIGKAWDVLQDPTKPFLNEVRRLLGTVPGTGNIKESAVKAVWRLTDEIIPWLGDKVKKFLDAGRSQGSAASIKIDDTGKTASGWKAMWAAVSKQFPNAKLHSGLREGAITVTGKRSYHATGRAIDVTPSAAIFNWIRSNYGSRSKELIYSPMGNAQIHNGSSHMYTGAVRDTHWDHVHWAMKHGGIFNFDNGGVLNPGALGVNNLGRPEAVLTPEESSGLKNMGVGELARLLERLIEATESVASGVGSELNGSVRQAYRMSRAR